MKQKSLFIVLALAGALCTSCSQDESFNANSSGNASEGMFKFSLNASDPTNGNALSSLHTYAFSDGQLIRKFENLDVTATSFQLSMPADKPKNLFFIANHTPLAIETGVPETTLSQITSSSAADTPPAIFLSTKASVGTNVTETAEVSLLRGVARIDLYPGTDDKLAIDSVVYEGGADRTFLFQTTPATVPADAAGVKYKKTYDTPLIGGADVTNSEVFNVYENGTNEVKIYVYGMFNGVPIKVIATAPAMVRNKIYTVKLESVGQTIQANIGIKDWEIGGDIIATPAT